MTRYEPNDIVTKEEAEEMFALMDQEEKLDAELAEQAERNKIE